MPRNVPYDMLQDLQRGVTTFCLLIRFDPVLDGFASYGMALLDRQVIYDDEISELAYSPIVAMQPSTILSSSDLSVDGGDGFGLVPEFDTPISEADLVAGAYDFCRFRAYIVDYRKLTPGRHILLQEGTTGQMRLTDVGLAFTQELRGKAQALMQSITEKWSLLCRAIPGSMPIGTGGGAIEQRFPCNWALTWEPGTVEAVGLESSNSFSTSGLAPAFGGNPGKVRWLTGRNAGREDEVDSFEDAGGVQTIGLTFGTMFPIQAGDTFEFADLCPGTKAACKARGNWANFRGEPNIPVGDAGQASVPGASAGIGTGGRLQIGNSEEQ